MAPPPTRRPGFSRKAQFGLFLGYVIAVGGVLLAGLLMIVAVVDPTGFSTLRGAALDATAPVTSGGRSFFVTVRNGWDEVGAYFSAASKNAEMRRELQASRIKLIEAEALRDENRRLKAMLKVSANATDAVTTARVVGSSFDSVRRLGTLDAGSASGVRVGQPVRGPEGLIGRVIETGRYAARILLVTDGASNVPVRLVRSGLPAIATGRGDGTIEIKPLEVGGDQFRRGDVLVTSGTGGIYPPNIPVAVVVHAGRDQTLARPIADPARIDFALVERVYQPAAQQPIGNEAATAGSP